VGDDTRYLLDEETVVDSIYLADDAVEDFMYDGTAFDLVTDAQDLGISLYFSSQAGGRLDERRDWVNSFEALCFAAEPYEERPMKTPDWYDGEDQWYDMAEVAKFTGSEEFETLLISEIPDFQQIEDRKDHLTVMSPEEAVDEFR
jgi:hypothetical protein